MSRGSWTFLEKEGKVSDYRQRISKMDSFDGRMPRFVRLFYGSHVTWYQTWWRLPPRQRLKGNSSSKTSRYREWPIDFVEVSGSSTTPRSGLKTLPSSSRSQRVSSLLLPALSAGAATCTLTVGSHTLVTSIAVRARSHSGKITTLLLQALSGSPDRLRKFLPPPKTMYSWWMCLVHSSSVSCSECQSWPSRNSLEEFTCLNH